MKQWVWFLHMPKSVINSTNTNTVASALYITVSHTVQFNLITRNENLAVKYAAQELRELSVNIDVDIDVILSLSHLHVVDSVVANV